jgi:hypothetical protein
VADTELGDAVEAGPAFETDFWTFRVECSPAAEVVENELGVEFVPVLGAGRGPAAEVEVDPEEAARHAG